MSAIPSLPPPSPCIRVCTLDEEQYCLGCGRHVSDIVAWTSMSSAQQWAVWKLSAQRRASTVYSDFEVINRER